MDSSACPEPDHLLAFALGRLSDEEIDRTAAHLETCAACEATMALVDQMADTMVTSLRDLRWSDAVEQDPHLQEALSRAQAMVNSSAVVEGPPSGVLAPNMRLGEYVLLEKLGQGGMGVVYRARHVHLDRIVAIKVLPVGRRDSLLATGRFQREMQATGRIDPADVVLLATARFYREMQAIGRIDHPQVVKALDAREIDGRPVMVLEYVAGVDLQTAARRVGTLAIADACEVARQAALGLQCVHENGLVHRDIKPSNLMLTPEGQVKILDLGLALFQADPPHDDLTLSGQAMGTFHYMAPEQFEDSHQVDIRADLYSLGCTLHFLLTGRTPARDRRRTPLARMMTPAASKPQPIDAIRPEAPRALVRLVERMLASSPDERPATPQEVAEALLPFAEGSDLAALASRAARASEEPQPNGQPLLAPLPARRRPRRGLGIGLLLGAMATLLLLAILIRIRMKDGQVMEIAAPSGSQVSVEESPTSPPATETSSAPQEASAAAANRDEPASAAPSPAWAGVKWKPRPSSVKSGSPLNPLALVTRPAAIPGVISWTLETVAQRADLEIAVAAAFRPDGRELLTLGYDGVARFWDVETNRLLRAFASQDLGMPWGNAEGADKLAWSPDGSCFATYSDTRHIRIIQASTGDCVGVLSVKGALTGGLAWSPNGQWLATGDGEGRSYLWDMTQDAPTFAREMSKQATGITSLAWGQDSRRMVVSTKEGCVVVCHGNIPDDTITVVIGGPANPVFKAAWSPDGIRVAWATDNSIELYQWEPERAHLAQNPGKTEYVTWVPGGETFLRCCGGQTASWDWVGQTSFWSVPYPLLAVAPESVGKLLLGNASFVDTRTGHPVGRLPALDRRSPYQGNVRISPDQRFLADVRVDPTAPEGSIVRVWDLKTGELRRSFATPNFYRSASPVPQQFLWWAEGRIVMTRQPADNIRVFHVEIEENGLVHFLSEAGTLETASHDRSLTVFLNNGQWEIWDAVTRERRCALPKRQVLAFSPDATRIAVGGGMELEIYDTQSGAKLVALTGLKEELSPTVSPAWSPDGTKIAMRDAKQLYYWDTTSGQLRMTEPFPGPPVVLQWADNKNILSGNRETALVWNTETSTPVRQFQFPLPYCVDWPAYDAVGDLIVLPEPSCYRLHRISDGQLLRTLVVLNDQQWACVHPTGHFAGSPGVEKEFVYLVLTESGEQLTLTPEEFSAKYGWKNDPQQVFQDR